MKKFYTFEANVILEYDPDTVENLSPCELYLLIKRRELELVNNFKDFPIEPYGDSKPLLLIRHKEKL